MNPIRFSITVALVCATVVSAQMKKVAIFDYDDRKGDPKSVAIAIEKRLVETYNGTITVSHFSPLGVEQKGLSMLQELDNGGYAVLIVLTSDGLLQALHSVKKTPVVFSQVNNPKFLGIGNLDKPGVNFSGASYYVAAEKQLAFYTSLQPGIKKIGFIFDPDNKSKLTEVNDARNACLKLGLTFVGLNMKPNAQLHGPADIENDIRNVAQKLVAAKVDAIVLTSSEKVYGNAGIVKTVAYPAKTWLYSYNKKGVAKGAIAGLSSDYYALADKIVVPMVRNVLDKKIKLSETPVGFLPNPSVYLNMTEAAAAGYTIPSAVVNEAVEKY